jgi:E3 SUMO-protein ligase RanBP2
MRREQVFKICANHKITSQLELKPHPGIANAYVWSVVDFADGEGKHETFCVKFKIDEQAKQFVRIFNQSKGTAGDLLSIGRISLNDDDDDDVIPIGEVKPTHEQIERARKLQLPLTFYLYENKPPCKGCRGCREESSLNESMRNSLFHHFSKISIRFFLFSSIIKSNQFKFSFRFLSKFVLIFL